MCFRYLACHRTTNCWCSIIVRNRIIKPLPSFKVSGNDRARARRGSRHGGLVRPPSGRGSRETEAPIAGEDDDDVTGGILEPLNKTIFCSPKFFLDLLYIQLEYLASLEEGGILTHLELALTSPMTRS